MINAKNLGLSLGIVWGVCMFFFTWVAIIFPGYGETFFILLEEIYSVGWYSISAAGSFVGLVLGFIDGFIGGFLIAWIYNIFQKMDKKKSKEDFSDQESQG